MELFIIGILNMVKVINLFNLVLRTFKLKKLPFSVRFHPSSDKQNSFLCGSSNKKILQFDLNTGTK